MRTLSSSFLHSVIPSVQMIWDRIKKSIFFVSLPPILVVFGFLPHAECSVKKIFLKLSLNEKLVVVFGPMLMCFGKTLRFWFVYELFKTKKVHFLANMELTRNNFCW
jgi:phage-related protein